MALSAFAETHTQTYVHRIQIPIMIGNTTENMKGTFRKTVSFLFRSTGTPHLDKTQGNDDQRTGKAHRNDRAEKKVVDDPYATGRPQMQRDVPNLPTITGCSPQFYAPKPLPETTGKRGLFSGSSNIWKTVSKRVVQFRDSKHAKKFKHAWEKHKVSSISCAFLTRGSNISNQPRRKVFRFREFSRGPHVYPSLAYDEVTRVVVCEYFVLVGVK